MIGIFTIYQIFILIVVGLVAFFISWVIFADATNPTKWTILITVVSIIVVGGCLGWHNTQTASGIRAVKDFQSNINNGIEREITITAEDSREIFSYEGKVDVEFNGDKNYLKFESEDGKRYIIHYGIQDTIIIREK